MSEFKFGDEVQYLARSGVWMDARYIYCSFNQHVVLGDNPVNLCYSYSDDIRRKPRIETMMIQIIRTTSGYYYPCKVGSSVGQFEANVGEPFEHTFEASDE